MSDLIMVAPKFKITRESNDSLVNLGGLEDNSTNVVHWEMEPEGMDMPFAV